MDNLLWIAGAVAILALVALLVLWNSALIAATRAAARQSSRARR